MKVIIKKQELNKLFDSARQFLQKKTIVDTLGCFRVDIDVNAMSVSASDMDMNVTVKTNDVIAETPFSVLIPAEALMNSVKYMNEDIVITNLQEKERVRVSSGKKYALLKTLPVDKFPILMSKPIGVKLPINDIQDMFAQTSSCMSTEETLYTLNSVALRSRSGMLDFISTDGKRMVLSSPEAITAKPVDVIVPSKLVHIVSRLFGKFEVTVGDRMVSFESKNLCIYSKLIEGTYPNYSSRLPENLNLSSKLTVDSHSLSQAVKFASSFSDKTSAVKLDLVDDVLSVSTPDNNAGDQAKTEVSCVSDEDISFGFNGVFLCNALDSFDGEITIKYQIDKPAIVISSEDSDIFHICAPMAL